MRAVVDASTASRVPPLPAPATDDMSVYLQSALRSGSPPSETSSARLVSLLYEAPSRTL
jgi:hypothetical protein